MSESVGASTMRSGGSVANLLNETDRQEYAKRCDAIHLRLVHSNFSAHVVWEILEFLRLAGDVFLPDERALLTGLLSNAADRVVVTVVALTERKAKGRLNFASLAKFLQDHSPPSSRAAVLARLDSLRLEERRKGLLGRAEKARHELIAHFNLEQALGMSSDDRRLLIEDVLTLQDEAQEIFDGLRIDRTIGFSSQVALTRKTLHLLAGAYGDRVESVSKDILREMLQPGTILPDISPWQLGRLPAEQPE